jgi:hypothetical protein
LLNPKAVHELNVRMHVLLDRGRLGVTGASRAPSLHSRAISSAGAVLRGRNSEENSFIRLVRAAQLPLDARLPQAWSIIEVLLKRQTT